MKTENKGKKKSEKAKKNEPKEQKPKEENIDYKDRYLRLLAEFENARKRMDREKMDFIKG